MSVSGPASRLFQSYLGAETIHRAGAQHVLNAEYFQRIDALNLTMLHDDGQHVEGLEEATSFGRRLTYFKNTDFHLFCQSRRQNRQRIPRPSVPWRPRSKNSPGRLWSGFMRAPSVSFNPRNRLLGLKAHRDDDQYIDKTAVAEEVSRFRGDFARGTIGPRLTSRDGRLRKRQQRS